ncbi:MAG: type 1 glutamine amidotransferase [Actinomycetota bacterium]
MRALAIVHQRDAGPGVFADAMRSQGVELETWMPPEAATPPRDARDCDAVLVLGGAMHADQEDDHPWLPEEKALLAGLLEDGTPLLGVCLGAQLLAEAAGGTPRRLPEAEIGWHEVEVSGAGMDDPLLGPLAPRFRAFQWHSYECTLPPGAVALAQSAACMQAYRVGERAWGIQFHAEVSAADAESWIADYRSDRDAVRIGLDAEALRASTAEAIGAWNEVGRDLCGRFLAAVAAPA